MIVVGLVMGVLEYSFFLRRLAVVWALRPWGFSYVVFVGMDFHTGLLSELKDAHAPDDTQKSHRSRHRMHKSSESSHRTMSKSLSSDSQSKGSVSTPRGSTKVDLSKLEIAALWRYWRQLLLDC
uniref:Uncharacterized protein n=1 Tax=Quercus lobata TaxID=97700 RepID=A0A7N2KL29_QUELO